MTQSSTLRHVAHRWHEALERASVGSRTRQLQRAAELFDRNLCVVDVGCRWGIAEAWEVLGSRATVIGFDPDARECDRLRDAYRGACDVRFLAAALGAESGPATLYVTQDPGCSSLLEPDAQLAATVPELACLRCVARRQVAVTTLDECARSAGIEHVDFMKVDTQGSELMILRGSDDLLSGTRALEVEVELNPLYLGQPLFGEVDAFLRSRGFVLWRLKHLAHYRVAGPAARAGGVNDRQIFDSRPVHVAAEDGQLFWGNAYFVRKHLTTQGDGSDWPSRLRDACLFTILGFHDLASLAFDEVATHAPPEVGRRLVRS